MAGKQLQKNVFFAGLIAAIGWFAVILQFVLYVPVYMGNGRTFGGTIVHFLSYFTIETNTLLAFSLTAVLLFPATYLGRFFSKTSTATAIAVYITIVGLVYNLVLRKFSHAQGAFRVDDELLHVFMPVSYLLYWFFLLPKKVLKWNSVINWLSFPFLYLIYILVRGAISGFYPYFFLDVKTYGYAQVAINSFVLLILFAVLNSLFILIGRWQSRNAVKT